MNTPQANRESAQPLAALLAFLLPGLGHAFLGHTRRGLLIAASILTLFFSGIAIGGIDVIDRKEDWPWFLGQALVGPAAFAIDAAHQSMKRPDPSSPTRSRAPRPDENPPYQRSLAHLNEIGALYATLAGLLNLIAIIDAAWHTPRRRRDGAPA